MYSAACATLESNMASNRAGIRLICGLLTKDKGVKATKQVFSLSRIASTWLARLRHAPFTPERVKTALT